MAGLEDVEYNLARLEGQLAKFDSLINRQTYFRAELCETLKMAKQFLSSLRLALDPHRIDVI